LFFAAYAAADFSRGFSTHGKLEIELLVALATIEICINSGVADATRLLP
jgi:hypothetical protein